MRLHVHRSGADLLPALAAEKGCHYATFGSSAIAPAVLREAEASAQARGHIQISSLDALRAPAEAHLRRFFERAGRADPGWRYAHSSRVLLAVPGYPDLALLFLLRALRDVEPHATVHALVADEWLARLLRFEVEGGPPPRFHARRARGFARAGRTLLRSLAAPRARRRCDVLVFTLGENLANGGADAYFGDFFATLSPHAAVHTVYAAPGRRLRLPGSRSASPLESYLKTADVVRAAADSLADRAPESPDDADAVLIDYLRSRERDAGEPVMLRIMAAGFERMLAALAPRTVLYPFENRSWEKHLLRAARARGVRTIGYQHSSITPRHLAFSGAAGLCGLDDLPDTVITCGEVTAGLIAAEIPQARSLIRVGAALRAKRLAVPAPARGVLAPISSSRAEAWEMLKVLYEASALLDHPIVVRTHPTIPVDDLYAQFNWPAHVQLSRGRALAEDFAEAGTVVYSSSTVALEGLLYGRLPVYLEIGDIPSGDPLHGEHPFVFRAADAQALAGTLRKIEAMDPGELARLREQGRAYAERYLAEPGADALERMAVEVARC